MNCFDNKPKKGYGFIYCYTSPSGKKYVGQTCRSLKERYENGRGYLNSTAFLGAIQKYGFESFEVKILEEVKLDNLDKQEKYWIEALNTIVPNGYNIKSGGTNEYSKRSKRSTKVYQFDLNGNFIKVYESLREAAIDNNTNYQSISAVLRGVRAQHNGYIYRYSNDKPEKVELKKTSGRLTAQLNQEGKIIQVFPSANKAAEGLGKDKNAGRNIRLVCEGKRKTAYGFGWKYLD